MTTKGEKKTRSWTMGLSVALSVVVAGIAIALSMPFPDLQWDEVVVPNAIEYMEKAMGVVWDDESSSASKQQPLRGMYIVVTGATSGIGLGLTRKLCLLGATVVAMGRSSSKLQQLQQEWPQNIETVLADFSDLDSIAAASQYMIEHYDRLDILVNNAGMHPGLGQVSESKQGYDLTFTVNYLSHFLLTEKLMPVLKKSSYPKVVQVSSGFHFAVDGSDLSTNHGTRDPIASQKGGSHGFLFFRGQRQYANSKFAQILHTRSLQQHYGIRAVSSCPAWVGTQIGPKNGTIGHALFASTAFPVEGFGLSSILYAMLDPNIDTKEDYYMNVDFAPDKPNPLDQLPPWTYQTFPLRDMIVGGSAISVTYIFQRFAALRSTGKPAMQTHDQNLQEELYTWSRQAVASWL